MPGNAAFPPPTIQCVRVTIITPAGVVIYPVNCSLNVWNLLGGLSWIAAFSDELLSPLATLTTTYNSAVSSHGCINTFAKSVALSFVPSGPSLSDIVPAAQTYQQLSNVSSVISYAASRTNYLGGTGLLYPLKSRVVGSMLARGTQLLRNAPMIQGDAALLQGAISEVSAAYQGACQ